MWSWPRSHGQQIIKQRLAHTSIWWQTSYVAILCYCFSMQEVGGILKCCPRHKCHAYLLLQNDLSFSMVWQSLERVCEYFGQLIVCLLNQVPFQTVVSPLHPAHSAFVICAFLTGWLSVVVAYDAYQCVCYDISLFYVCYVCACLYK